MCARSDLLEPDHDCLRALSVNIDCHAATHVRERANFLTTKASVEKHALEAKVYGSAHRHVTLVTVKYRSSPAHTNFLFL